LVYAQAFRRGKGEYLVSEHRYAAVVTWTGDRGTGTSSYAGYSRDHLIGADGKAPIEGSADPHFRGDGSRWNPEELLVASIAACHQLWYLHLCAVAGVRVTRYEDRAEGIMVTDAAGSGRFTHVTLKPRVWIAAGSDAEAARAAHADAHRMCFIANSLNFPVDHQPEIIAATS
jgi:organic hydroperoxide reductase OsmC/OhrA